MTIFRRSLVIVPEKMWSQRYEELISSAMKFELFREGIKRSRADGGIESMVRREGSVADIWNNTLILLQTTQKSKKYLSKTCYKRWKPYVLITMVLNDVV